MGSSVDLQKLVPFKKPQGIELTFVPKRGSRFGRWDCPRSSRYRERYTAAFHGVWNLCRETGHIGTDPEVVEHSSPILKSWDHAYEWYNTAVVAADSVGLTPWREGLAGGGGHIHTGKLCRVTILNLMADLQARPYVVWSCIDPGDTINALGVHNGAVLNRLGSAFLRHMDELPSHGVAVRYRNYLRTMEWRAWDSAADWDIQELQLAFVQRYVDWARTRPYRVIPYMVNVPGASEFQYRQMLSPYTCKSGFGRCAREFKSFVKDTLELPWKSYEWLVERNLEPRFKTWWGQRV